MNAPVVQFSEVSKRFAAVHALKGLTFDLPAGGVVGLLGRNGAGKSTALRTLVGLYAPDTGSVRVLGRDPLTFDVAIRRRIGYLSDDGVPFPAATGKALLRLCAPLYPSWSRALEDQMLARFHIDPRRKLKELSLGQQRAVALLLALCPQPELLILDEPAANLDPVLRREFLDTVLSLVATEQRTVILSSHVLSDIERIADRVMILHHGQLLLNSPLDDLKENARRLRFVFPAAPPERLPLPGAFAVRRSGRELLTTVMEFDEATVTRLASTLGARVEATPVKLDELFIDLVGDGSEHASAAA
ncbi:MAG: ABC transporter ATP-binding protein [Polyangia bacterium]